MVARDRIASKAIVSIRSFCWCMSSGSGTRVPSGLARRRNKASCSSVSLRQIHLPQQRGEARVAVKQHERCIVPEIGHIAIVVLVSPIQPFESFVSLAAPRVELRETVGVRLPPLDDKLIECLLRLSGVTERMLGHSDARRTKPLVAERPEGGQCLRGFALA